MATIDPNAWRRGWFALLAPYGALTDDNRILEEDSIVHRELPLPLSLQILSKPGHAESVVVGAITSFASTSAGVFASGTWLDPAAVPEVSRAIALVEAGIARPSLDLTGKGLVAKPEEGEAGERITRYFAATSSGATMVAVPAFDGTYVRLGPESGELSEMMEHLTASGFDGDALRMDGEDGLRSFALTGTTSWKSMPIASRDYPFNADEAVARIMQWANGNDAKLRSMHLIVRPEFAVGTRDRYVFPIGDIIDGRPHLVFHAAYSAAAILNGAHGGVKNITPDERARLQTVLTEIYQRMSQAFQDPNLEAPWVKRDRLPERSRTASAGGAPVAPPASWFSMPEPDRPVKMTVLPDGRVFGHLAAKGTCHVGLGQLTGECVTPPESRTGYRVFHTGTVRCAGGESIGVGRITIGTTHPIGATGANLTAAATASHYDNTGSCAAVVRAVDGKHGIWLSGALVPEADERTAATLRRSPLSGDWRRVGGNLELVAALAVNSPGFPVFSLDPDGDRVSLTASATCLDEPTDMIDDMDTGTQAGEEPVQDQQPEPAATEPPAGEPATADTTPAPTVDMDQLRAMLGEELQRIEDHRKLVDELDGMVLGHWSELNAELEKLGPIDDGNGGGDGV